MSEGSAHVRFRELYGYTELAMAAGYLSAYIAPRPLIYAIYISLTALFLPAKMQSGRADFRLISRGVIPGAVSEFFSTWGWL